MFLPILTISLWVLFLESRMLSFEPDCRSVNYSHRSHEAKQGSKFAEVEVDVG